jgi:hypothetical protein
VNAFNSDLDFWRNQTRFLRETLQYTIIQVNVQNIFELRHKEKKLFTIDALQGMTCICQVSVQWLVERTVSENLSLMLGQNRHSPKLHAHIQTFLLHVFTCHCSMHLPVIYFAQYTRGRVPGDYIIITAFKKDQRINNVTYTSLPSAAPPLPLPVDSVFNQHSKTTHCSAFI